MAGGPMQACTAQWQAQGLSRGEYRPFLLKCLNGQAVAAVTLKAASKFESTKKAGRTSSQGNRMKMCGARWQTMKATGATNGLKWQQFSSQCLRTKK